MTSVLTNTSSMAALQTLRSVSCSLQKTQGQVGSGLRVQVAADNVAYWSIATTMRSDGKAISAAGDALSLGAAKVDTAYEGMDAVNNVLSEFKAKLVAAKEPSIDKAQVQNELEQLKNQVLSIAQGASFSGENWLSTDIEDINDSDQDVATVVSSFTRNPDATVSVNTARTHLAEVSLFNSTGGGLLQSDTRNMRTLGGIRLGEPTRASDGSTYLYPNNIRSGTGGSFTVTFSGPLVFDDPADQIAFDITVDADDQSVLPGPYEAGKTTSISITRSTLDAYDAAYSGDNLNGRITTYKQYVDVLNYAFQQQGSDASAYRIYRYNGATQQPEYVENAIEIATNESSGLDGSYVGITGFTSNVGSGGLGNFADYGDRSQQMVLAFSPFEVFKDGDDPNGVTVDFNFGVNRQSAKHYSFDRTYVNDLLGRDTGKIETADEMVTVLQSLLASDWPDVTIANNGSGGIAVSSNVNPDRSQGFKTSIGFTDIAVSIEPISDMNFLDIDIASNPEMIDSFISYIDERQAEVINGAAVLGALSTRIEFQMDYAGKLMDSIDEGVSRLVDTDMEEASSRLAALQTQQQLAVRSLSIANASSDGLLTLFQ